MIGLATVSRPPGAVSSHPASLRQPSCSPGWRTLPWGLCPRALSLTSWPSVPASSPGLLKMEPGGLSLWGLQKMLLKPRPPLDSTGLVTASLLCGRCPTATLPRPASESWLLCHLSALCAGQGTALPLQATACWGLTLTWKASVKPLATVGPARK